MIGSSSMMKNPRGEATGDVARAALQERAHARGVQAHDEGGLGDREIFDGREQERLPDQRRERRQIAVERRFLGRFGGGLGDMRP